MYGPATMAFLHHLAAFTVVATLAAEVALFRPPLSAAQARRLVRTDTLYGVSAALVLVVGLLRVAYFEKGPSYYWHDLFFLIKLGAFATAGLISIYPTVVFLGFNRALRAGTPPEVSPERARRVRLCLLLELGALAVVLAGAALMARGFGYRS